MLSRDTLDGVKGAVNTAQTIIKRYWKYWKPTLFTLGRITSSASGVLNSAADLATKGYRHYTGNPTAKAPGWVSATVQAAPVIASIATKAGTNGFSIFAFFDEKDSDAKYKYQMPGEVESLEHAHDEAESGSFDHWIHPELNNLWNGIFIGLRGTLNISLCFMYLNTFYSSMKLVTLIAQLLTGTSDASTAGIIVEILFATFFAISSAVAQLSLNIPSSLSNYAEILKKIQNGETKLTPELAITLFLVLLNMTSTIFASYYSTSYAFEWYKAQVSILNMILAPAVTKALVLASTSVGGVSELGRGSSVYRLITKWKDKLYKCRYPTPDDNNPLLIDNEELLPSYWNHLRMGIIAAGAVEAAYAGMLNLNSVPYVASQLTPIEPDNTALQTFAVFTGAASGLITFAFTLEAINQAQERLIANRKKALRNVLLEELVLSDSESESDSDNTDITTPLLNKHKFAAPKQNKLQFFDAPEVPKKKTKNQDKYFNANELSDEEENLLLNSESSSSDSDTGSGYTKLIKQVGSEYML